MRSTAEHNTTSTLSQVLQNRLVFVVLWVVLFTLAYAQSPLYTSNQNQYFLHGYARAGYGLLAEDWLSNTLDPTPVFSSLIFLTYKLFSWPPIFYLYFAILAGVYLFSLAGIAKIIFKIQPQDNWLLLTVLVLLHSAALRYLFVRIFNADWAYLLDGGVAGQRLLGSVLQPSAFGVLLLLAIYCFMQEKPAWTVALLALTPTLHPTYLVSAGVLTLVLMGILYFERRSVFPPLIFGGLTFIGVLPILIHAFLTFGGTDPHLTAASRQLLVDFRIPHHAVIAEWLDGSVLVKLMILLGGLYLTRKTRLFHIFLWPFGVALFGTVAQWWLDLDVLALMFPWRQSTWLVPVALAVISGWVVSLVSPWLVQRSDRHRWHVVGLVLSVLLAGIGLVKTVWEARDKQAGTDRPMMEFVHDNKTSGDIYLIPLDMQDFRLETGAPTYVEFKSIPYQDADLLEWNRRVTATGNFYRIPYKRIGCDFLADFYAQGVTHVVLPYDHLAATCDNLDREFLDIENYEVFRILGP